MVRPTSMLIFLAWIGLLASQAACATGEKMPAVVAVSPTAVSSPSPAHDNDDPLPELASPPAQAPPETAIAAPALEDWPCQLWVPGGDVLGDTLQCGYVVVPAERDNPASKAVKLTYVLLKATGDNVTPDPIIHVAGGPGISATSRSAVVELARRYAPFRESRDIILYDQRGVGNSLPYLTCSAFMEADSGREALSPADRIDRCQVGMRDQGYPPETFAADCACCAKKPNYFPYFFI